jgi:hypothetical protein
LTAEKPNKEPKLKRESNRGVSKISRAIEGTTIISRTIEEIFSRNIAGMFDLTKVQQPDRWRA